MLSIGDLWAFAKKVDQLAGLEEKQGKVIAAIQTQLDELADRITKLEAREEIMTVKAQAAAGMAASAVVAELSRRLGVIEGQVSAQVDPHKSRRQRLPKA
jgi:hypothetical protein